MKNLTQLELILKEASYPLYRAKQIIQSVYKNGVTEYQQIKNIPLQLREFLSANVPILSLTPIHHQNSKDGFTEKVLFQLSTGEKIESVLMKFKDGRNTICISSQAGCTMGCKFCATGAMKFSRSLTAEEITDQVLYFFSKLKNENQQITNIVYMGMGEPFLNYENTIASINTLIDPKHFNFGSRRITVSTCGIIPGIEKFTLEPFQVNLAISLHAPTQLIREKIMPVAKIYPLKELLESINKYINKTNRRVSFEYILLKDINDSGDSANELINISKKNLIHINLIPYNNTDLNSLSGSDKKRISEFKNILQSGGINATVRLSMGQDIDAACGQLANIS
jgi:23S rRNA (adenine2503-C2)-methyltransferase